MNNGSGLLRVITCRRCFMFSQARMRKLTWHWRWEVRVESDAWEVVVDREVIWCCCCCRICCCPGAWWPPAGLGWMRGRRRPSSPRSQHHTAPCCRTGRTGPPHRTCGRTPGRRSTPGDRRWFWPSSPSRMPGWSSCRPRSIQWSQTAWNEGGERRRSWLARRSSPEVVSLAEEEVPLGVERLTHLPQSGVTAAALEAVLVPEEVHGLRYYSEGGRIWRRYKPSRRTCRGSSYYNQRTPGYQTPSPALHRWPSLSCLEVKGDGGQLWRMFISWPRTEMRLTGPGRHISQSVCTWYSVELRGSLPPMWPL